MRPGDCRRAVSVSQISDLAGRYISGEDGQPDGPVRLVTTPNPM
jgi:hypothetical protein